jgi:hypothetical protein
MAAIDKLYVRTYEEYDEVRRWALVYYPKLLLYFYNISISYKEFNEMRKKWFINTQNAIIDDYTFPVMNTPCKIDRKLKWICPVPCVREYLHKQCGVNPKWGWLYKIFWKGKKYF